VNNEQYEFLDDDEGQVLRALFAEAVTDHEDGPEDLHSLIMETKTGKNGPCVLLEDAVKALCGRTLAEVIEEIQDGAGSEVTLAGPDSWGKSP
jgi:hypothetical protein